MNKEAWRLNLHEFELLNKHLDELAVVGSNSYAHELGKFNLAYRLNREGKHYLSEGVLRFGRGRCDIVDLHEPTIFEVAASESEASLHLKKLKYPARFGLEIIRV